MSPASVLEGAGEVRTRTDSKVKVALDTVTTGRSMGRVRHVCEYQTARSGDPSAFKVNERTAFS